MPYHKKKHAQNEKRTHDKKLPKTQHKSLISEQHESPIKLGVHGTIVCVKDEDIVTVYCLLMHVALLRT